MFLTRPSAYGQDFLKILIEKKIMLGDICPCLQGELASVCVSPVLVQATDTHNGEN